MHINELLDSVLQEAYPLIQQGKTGGSPQEDLENLKKAATTPLVAGAKKLGELKDKLANKASEMAEDIKSHARRAKVYGPMYDPEAERAKGMKQAALRGAYILRKQAEEAKTGTKNLNVASDLALKKLIGQKKANERGNKLLQQQGKTDTNTQNLPKPQTDTETKTATSSTLQKIAGKVSNFATEHPGTMTGVAGALGAGLGLLAGRKLLKRKQA